MSVLFNPLEGHGKSLGFLRAVLGRTGTAGVDSVYDSDKTIGICLGLLVFRGEEASFRIDLIHIHPN